jgi:hypothetical protein
MIYSVPIQDQNGMHMQRSENFKNENKLENKKKQQIEKIKLLKIERSKVYSQLLNLTKDIDDDLVQIEVLQNFEKYTDGLNGVNNAIKQHDQIKTNKRQNQEDKEKLFYVASKIQQNRNYRERDCNELKASLPQKKLLKDKKKHEIAALNNIIKTENNELKSVKNQLMIHYHILLKEGKDTRQEGLSWIIKAIWNLGYNVIMSYLPNFLDEIAIEYIFAQAHKDIKLQELKSQIDELKKLLKKTIKESNPLTKRGKRQSDTTFKTVLQVIY